MLSASLTSALKSAIGIPSLVTHRHLKMKLKKSIKIGCCFKFKIFLVFSLGLCALNWLKTAIRIAFHEFINVR